MIALTIWIGGSPFRIIATEKQASELVSSCLSNRKFFTVEHYAVNDRGLLEHGYKSINGKKYLPTDCMNVSKFISTIGGK